MRNLNKLINSLSLAVFLAVSLPNMALANERGTEPGDDVSIIVDLLVLRPAGLVATVAGTVFFVAALPFSLPTLSVGKTFRALVVAPAHYTFVRDLGDER